MFPTFWTISSFLADRFSQCYNEHVDFMALYLVLVTCTKRNRFVFGFLFCVSKNISGTCIL